MDPSDDPIRMRITPTLGRMWRKSILVVLYIRDTRMSFILSTMPRLYLRPESKILGLHPRLPGP